MIPLPPLPLLLQHWFRNLGCSSAFVAFPIIISVVIGAVFIIISISGIIDIIATTTTTAVSRPPHPPL